MKRVFGHEFDGCKQHSLWFQPKKHFTFLSSHLEETDRDSKSDIARRVGDWWRERLRKRKRIRERGKKMKRTREEGKRWSDKKKCAKSIHLKKDLNC